MSALLSKPPLAPAANAALPADAHPVAAEPTTTTAPLVVEPFDGVEDMVWAIGHLLVTSVNQVKMLDPDGTILKAVLD
ncbi:hypothetical protein [Microlunatus antarcticus]|uniref:Uncharacterized protein n=1 Tax=Microlunatus antarcticus TaxID=53388 RepID=A0A7W5JZZ5_9ACTN|nr:hypothetical protein [Microlunatus antarcticus]MBB3328832.1 hypothetical protein [Microlunatus antarcticus]